MTVTLGLAWIIRIISYTTILSIMLLTLKYIVLSFTNKSIFLTIYVYNKHIIPIA